MISGLNLACFSVSRLQLNTLELMDKTMARWPSGRNKSGFTILKWIMFMCKRMRLVALALGIEFCFLDALKKGLSSTPTHWRYEP